MPDPIRKTNDVADAASRPVETTKDLAAEADRGQSERTPAIALTGVTIAVGALVALILVATFLVYYLV
jgi:hypothetical protein